MFNIDIIIFSGKDNDIYICLLRKKEYILQVSDVSKL